MSLRDDTSQPGAYGADLKRRLAAGETVLAPGVYDALTALTAEQAGFNALYLSTVETRPGS